MTIAEDLQLIAQQEKLLVVPRFDADFGWQIGAHLHEIARARSLPIAIDVRTFGQPIFYSALAGATPDNADWVRRKSNTVAQFRCSSYAVGLRLAESAATLSEKFGLSNADYATHGGGFPLTVQGAGVIGSITVSGLPQRDDHALIVEALCALLDHDPATLQLAYAEDA
ncbi:heme-degrading domain-containing protein [Paraburkholderia sp. BCC1886]|uniref:heme-degrading domain-containing protein n=1 Tax=Paraburkholderia sp. BCC1886 TaxID=2562670 RepID=UPI001181E2EE|nr:heme-degrading domain-containing protein [Paraburkholderia sp. BCC1886]